MPFLETARGRLFAAQRGSDGIPLVCLHGAGGNHQHWGWQVQALHEIARVAALDLPGHGRSPGPGCRSIAAYSEALVAALDALEIEQAVLAGHSMGGGVALWTALAAPERVMGLVLVSTGARLRVMSALLDQTMHDPAAAVRTIVGNVYSDEADPSLRETGLTMFSQADPEVLHTDLLACNAFDVMGQLTAIRCPTLVLCGTEDRMTPPKFSRYLHDAIGESSLVLVPQAGHMLMIEQPALVNTAIQQFLTVSGMFPETTK